MTDSRGRWKTGTKEKRSKIEMEDKGREGLRAERSGRNAEEGRKMAGEGSVMQHVGGADIKDLIMHSAIGQHINLAMGRPQGWQFIWTRYPLGRDVEIYPSTMWGRGGGVYHHNYLSLHRTASVFGPYKWMTEITMTVILDQRILGDVRRQGDLSSSYTYVKILKTPVPCRPKIINNTLT